ncbi:MAG TPA: aspartyl-phosphate phosphatase Spo0E family protein [Pseudoneobacillus sp.]|uniref:aspartyl-phosphate phosphatase Spo0E family protein n=1 Tax=Neobacillus sp. PS2-9 TaxID=3070676 RepID=UPI0027E0D9F5|nr:aspartyl-phosphate phosphatase Spo0E family protein [Neobacillus sp. PS2-9]WML56991.1 aspartyl-phosphate phosphatase Spo0E family protein [Neobacillus sp. PS2-9]HLO12783.1 aspartyl-phosphate phosphatase Spo0E family protein [Pseudoneobacillus sp.]
MYKDSINQNDMIEQIRAKRELMINCANTLGYTSEETIKYSQELDELINDYHRVMGQASRPNEEVKIAFKQMIMIWPKVLI